MNLFAHKEIWDFKKKFPDEFDSYGCGPGGMGDWLVPDTVYGLSIRDACRIHDTYYRHWNISNEKARKMADRIFKNNMLRIVKEKTNNQVLFRLRRRRCKTYYKMVRFAGGPAFWDERNGTSKTRKPVPQMRR